MSNENYETNLPLKVAAAQDEICELVLFMRPIKRNRWACDVYAVFSRPGWQLRYVVATGGSPQHPISFVKAGMALRLLGGWRKVSERRGLAISEDEVAPETFPVLAVNRIFGLSETYRRPIVPGRAVDEPPISLEALNRFLNTGGV